MTMRKEHEEMRSGGNFVAHEPIETDIEFPEATRSFHDFCRNLY